MNEEPESSRCLAAVHAHIASAAKRARRDAADIRLIAISKTHDSNAITHLIEAGQRTYGENRVQEAAGKWPELRSRYPDLELHLVGQLQSNKAEEAVSLFDCIHSLDRLSLVTALGKAMDKTGCRIPLFIQVNIGEEPQKGGCSVAELPSLLAAARNADLPIIGLMAVPPLDLEPTPYFALLAKMAWDNGLAGLSMGMSSDYEKAIQLGATHIRVGTALFGDR